MTTDQPQLPVKPGIKTTEFSIVTGLVGLDAAVSMVLDSALPVEWRAMAYGLVAVYVAGRSLVKAFAK